MFINLNMASASSNILDQPNWTVPPIDVEGIAKESNSSALVELLAIIISMAVLSPSVSFTFTVLGLLLIPTECRKNAKSRRSSQRPSGFKRSLCCV